jgi:hypothetical protein
MILQIVESNCFKIFELLKVFLIFFKLITGSQILIVEKLVKFLTDSQTEFQEENSKSVLFHSDHHNQDLFSKFSYE